MDFQKAVKTCLTEKYATFSGRASRSEYWWFILAYVVGAILVSLLGVGLLYALYVLALIVPVTAAGFRRLQDTGRPGWYILIPVALSLLSAALTPAMTPMGPGGGPGHMPGAGGMGLVAVLGIVQLVVVIIFIYWLTRPSQPETNTYGPPPQE
jgi:uncharacterized membrane protein YhaH (DUF805 family)